MNPALERILTLRRATGWWARRPVDLDRRGLTAIPAGVDLRRFRGASGETLVVIDDGSRREGLTYRLDGRERPLPADALSIDVVS